MRSADGYCDAHRKAVRKRFDSLRGSAHERGYDMAWKRVRGAFLRAHPLCECDECKAGQLVLTPAEVVDHVIPIEERPDLRLVWANLRAMSKRCHDRRTARDQGFGRGSGGRG